MKGSFVAAGLAAVLLFSASARAEPASFTDGLNTGGFAQTNPPPAANTQILAPNLRHPYFAWAGIGFYDIGISACDGQFCVSASSTQFGFNAGGAYDLIALTPDLPLSAFANVGLGFGSFGVTIPITIGAAVHYDKLPVQLLGGLGFTLMPNTGDNTPTPIGLGILLMAAYPLPQLKPGISVEAQFQYHFLDDSFSLLVFDVGLEYGF
jgi:hypothetical protein